MVRRESGSWEPERALGLSGRRYSRRRRLRRPRERGRRLRGCVRRRRRSYRIGGRFERLLEPASKSFHLTGAAIEAVYYLEQGFFLVDQGGYQGLSLLPGFYVVLFLPFCPGGAPIPPPLSTPKTT